MTRFLTSLVLLALLTPTQVHAASPRQRAVHSTGLSTGSGSRILWIGAHPDDETVIAPLLGTACVEGHAECSFLVFTRGEAGICKLPGGCAPGLGAIREAEMQRSAGLFRASIMQWELSDVMTGVAERWAEESGGRGALVTRIRDAITRERPSVVLTFDPAHGTTCHPAHRAVAELVMEAVDAIDVEKPPLFVLETTVAFRAEIVAFSSALAPGTSSIVIAADASWSYLAAVAGIHASQFTDAEVEALRATPASQRRIVLSAHEWPRTYAVTCP